MNTPFDDPQAELAWMFLQSLCDGGDLDEGFALLSDDFTHWSIFTGESANKASLRRSAEQRPGQTTLHLIRCVNEGETVVIEAQAEGATADGVRYAGPFIFVFETRDGLITSVREYGDTRLAARVL
ncbi:MAG TPA: nuclear transport factor 2 family protein [Mycobacterium sp.]